MIIHIVPSPIIPTYNKYVFLAHNMIAINLCSMFKSRGHIVYFYGIENAEVSATKIIPVINKEEYKNVIVDSDDLKDPRYMRSDVNFLCNDKVRIREIFYRNLRYKLYIHYTVGDIVLHVAPCINENFFVNDMIHVDASVGGGVILFSNIVYVTEPYKYYIENISKDLVKTPTQHSTVILPWFDPSEFEIGEKEKDTYLYLARCSKYKGLYNYLDISKEFLNRTFLIAGGTIRYDTEKNILIDDENQEINLNEYPNVKYIGVVNANERRDLLSNISLLIQPTLYLEPCGWNVVEAMLSGTPCLASARGGFCQTIIHGTTGFLCSSIKNYIDILNERSYEKLNPKQLRDYAIRTFSEERAYKQYIDFFSKLS